MPRKKPSDKYRNLRARAAEGEYDFVLPLDARLLEKFPKEGELFGNLYPLTKSAEQVRKEFDPPIPIKVVFPRLRSLNEQGLLVKARTLGDRTGIAYQISERGQAELKKLKAAETNTNKEEDDGGSRNK